MAHLVIDLPEDLAEEIRQRARQGGYPNPSDYIRALIVAGGDRSASLPAPPQLVFRSKSELETMLKAGLDSGDSREISAAEWAEKRRQLTERHGKKRSP